MFHVVASFHNGWMRRTYFSLFYVIRRLGGVLCMNIKRDCTAVDGPSATSFAKKTGFLTADDQIRTFKHGTSWKGDAESHCKNEV